MARTCCPDFARLGVVGVADRDRERVGGVGGLRPEPGQQALDHRGDLILRGMAGADHRALDRIGRIFVDRQAGERGRQQRDAARLAELEGRHRVLVDEGLLDRRLGRPPGRDHRDQAAIELGQTLRQRAPRGRAQHAGGNRAQPIGLDLDDAPAGALQAGIDADQAHRVRP